MAWRFLYLTKDESEALNRAVNGSGGFETFMRRLQKQFNPATQTIKLSPSDLDDIPHYAFDFKQGGWQTRLLKIFERSLGPGLGRAVSEPVTR